MNKRWNILKHDRERIIPLSQALKVSPLIAALLISRGYETTEKAYKFLNPSLDDLHEIFRLVLGMIILALLCMGYISAQI